MFSEVDIGVTGFLCERPISGASDEVTLRATIASLTFQDRAQSSEFSTALSPSR